MFSCEQPEFVVFYLVYSRVKRLMWLYILIPLSMTHFHCIKLYAYNVFFLSDFQAPRFEICPPDNLNKLFANKFHPYIREVIHLSLSASVPSSHGPGSKFEKYAFLKSGKVVDPLFCFWVSCATKPMWKNRILCTP